jgi:hypothetical protein
MTTTDQESDMRSISILGKGRPGIVAALALAAGLGGVAAPAQAAAGWQPVETYDVPTGLANLQLGINCPGGLPVAHSGAYAMNNVGQTSQVYLTFNGPRIDIPSYNNWAFHFYWPAGAPAGIAIQYNVYCTKK